EPGDADRLATQSLFSAIDAENHQAFGLGARCGKRADPATCRPEDRHQRSRRSALVVGDGGLPYDVVDATLALAEVEQRRIERVRVCRGGHEAEQEADGESHHDPARSTRTT